MDTNRRIEISRRVYARLLMLYPAKHRAEYGADMLQVFTDQCRTTGRAGRRMGFIVLWIRTLIDLGINVFREHLTSPGSSLGMLEAVPDRPLPWKGVALVLVPGLIFFTSQVAQLTGKDWFFLMVYRAAYILIIPVLVVWAWKRKFPIWGLIPLGLLFNTILSVGKRLQFIPYVAPETMNPLLRWLVPILTALAPSTLQVAEDVVLLLAVLGLLWSAKRRAGIPRSAWAWLGVYLLLMVFHILANFHGFTPLNALFAPKNLEALLWVATFDLYTYGGFLVLILIGARLAGRQGRLAALLPLGYLLPTILYGRISNEWPKPATPEFTFMLTVSAAALAYRFLVALAGPLWIVRSASGQMQKRAGATSLIALLALQAVFNLAILLSNGVGIEQFYYTYFAVSEQLIIGAGIALALTLYRNTSPAQPVNEEVKLNSENASVA